MSSILRPGAGLLFMKVGTHARETLEDIIERKTKEIEAEGYALWGYGGNTCHPQSMVQPFAKTFEEKGEKIILCMHEMESKHFADPVRAEEYSEDGIKWQKVPKGINALGSRYALVIKNLKREKFDLSLGATKVALGRSAGKIGTDYIQGRVDKACFEMDNEKGDGKVVQIDLVADLSSPYAVYLRDKN